MLSQLLNSSQTTSGSRSSFQPVSIPKQNIFSSPVDNYCSPSEEGRAVPHFWVIKTSFAFEELFVGNGMRINREKTWRPAQGRGWMEKDGIEQGWMQIPLQGHGDGAGITQSLGFADLGSPLMSGFVGGFHGLFLDLSEFPRDGGRGNQPRSFLGWSKAAPGSGCALLSPAFLCIDINSKAGSRPEIQIEFILFLSLVVAQKNSDFLLLSPQIICAHHSCSSEQTNPKSVVLFKKFLCYINSKARSYPEIKIKFIPF